MNVALILAGGSGERMGSMNMPKQFIDIYGKPLIIHTLEVFDIHPEIDEIVISCKEEFIDDLKIMVRKFNINKVRSIVAAAETRQSSSFEGIKEIEKLKDEETIVVIHDAVRPLITSKIISANIDGARKYGAVDTVITADDTIVKSIDGLYIEEIPTRSELFMGQTPQSFKFDVVYEAHKYALSQNQTNATDDCRLVLNQNKKVALVKGDKLNFKITTQEDLTLLKAMIKLSKVQRI